jgi:hypothetical protein
MAVIIIAIPVAVAREGVPKHFYTASALWPLADQIA